MVRNINNLSIELFNILDKFIYQVFDTIESTITLTLIFHGKKIPVSNNGCTMYLFIKYYFPLNIMILDSIVWPYLSINYSDVNQTVNSNISKWISKKQNPGFV